MNIQHQNHLQEKENDLLKEDEIRVEQELGKGQRIRHYTYDFTRI